MLNIMALYVYVLYVSGKTQTMYVHCTVLYDM